MLYTTPLPPIDGNPYPSPAPPGAAAAAADGAFVGWSSNLGPVESALAGLAGALGVIGQNLLSTVGALGQAVGQLDGSPLPTTMAQLVAELNLPNPIGTRIPFTFTAPQLPSATPPTSGLTPALDQFIAQYLGNLLDYLLSLGYIPGPQG